MLAGHSYGGTVMSEAADGDPGVKALVYVASFLLEEGESTGELAGKFPATNSAPRWTRCPARSTTGNRRRPVHPAGQVPADLAADVPPQVAELMAATQRPIIAGALAEKATKAAGQTIPSWTLVTSQGPRGPRRGQRFMASRVGVLGRRVDLLSRRHRLPAGRGGRPDRRGRPRDSRPATPHRRQTRCAAVPGTSGAAARAAKAPRARTRPDRHLRLRGLRLPDGDPPRLRPGRDRDPGGGHRAGWRDRPRPGPR